MWLTSKTPILQSEKPNKIELIEGYWTLSSNADGSSSAWQVDFSGLVGRHAVDYGSYYGVRAVINLKL